METCQKHRSHFEEVPKGTLNINTYNEDEKFDFLNKIEIYESILI